MTAALGDLTRRDMKAIYREVAEKNGLAMANAIMRIWRIIMGLAVDDGLDRNQPRVALEATTPRPRRRIWTDSERKAYCDRAIETGRCQV